MFRQWLRSLSRSRGRSTLTRRPPSVVPRVESLEGREVPATLIATGLDDPCGSTIGPDGNLYVAEGAAGRIARVNPSTGQVTTFASGLPISPFAEFFGVGAVDVAFLGETAYVLTTLVGPDVGGNETDVVGIYRVDGPSSFTVIADIGTWSVANPSASEVFIASGSQYAMEPYHGGFLVTDGHHNRVLRVSLDGEITEQIAFGNIVPTGLAVHGNTVYMGQAGPIPHVPETGKVVSFGPTSTTATDVASGARLIVDVEFGRGRTLYALAQGVWGGPFEGDPALPDTGSLVRVNGNGTFTVIEDGLDRPTSLEFIGTTAYFVSLAGEVWRIDDVSGPPFGGGLLTVAGLNAPPSFGGANGVLPDYSGLGFVLGRTGDAGGRPSFIGSAADRGLRLAAETGGVMKSTIAPPAPITGIGWVNDIAFIDETASVLDPLGIDNPRA